MIKLRLAQQFVSSWLLGTAFFIMAFSMWWAHSIQSQSPVMLGWFGSMLMLLLLLDIKERLKGFPCFMFWSILLFLLVVALQMALGSLGIIGDVFGLLGK